MKREFNDQEKEMFNHLKKVIDPELMVNIVDLGLVYDVRVDEPTISVEIDISLTSPGCPLGDVILQNAEQVIQNEYPSFQVKVNLVWEPVWSLDRLTEEGKEALGRT